MLIDFEKKFREYLNEYKFENEVDDEELEEIAPELYLEWLDTPEEWLDDKSPNAYFGAFEPAALIELLGKYIFSNITLPGVLLNRIADTKEKTYPFLVALLRDYDGEKSNEIKRTVVRLIEEMDMVHPYELYIQAISNSTEKNDFAEACAEELKNAGDMQKENIIAAYEAETGAYAADCFLDVLTDISYDERVYTFVLEKFLYSETQKAFYASCLGKIGNEDAIVHLVEAIKNEDINYYEYMSIKNAIEELGGEIDIEKDFSGDIDYESLKKMKNMGE